MKDFLNYDGYLMKVLTKIMYIVSLNLLFLLASIPVFTIGASSTAMYTVLFHYLKNDEPDIIRDFFRAFRENFKKATFVWMVMLVVLASLVMNFYYLYQSQITLAEMIRILLNFVLILWMVMWVYLFPIITYFDNSIKGYVTFAVGLSLAKLPCTVLLILIQTIPILAVLFFAQYAPLAVILLVCCGLSLPAYYSAQLLLKLFRNYEGDKT